MSVGFLFVNIVQHLIFEIFKNSVVIIISSVTGIDPHFEQLWGSVIIMIYLFFIIILSRFLLHYKLLNALFAFMIRNHWWIIMFLAIKMGMNINKKMQIDFFFFFRNGVVSKQKNSTELKLVQQFIFHSKHNKFYCCMHMYWHKHIEYVDDFQTQNSSIVLDSWNVIYSYAATIISTKAIYHSVNFTL